VDAPRTLIDLLLRRSEGNPDGTAYLLVERSGPDGTTGTTEPTEQTGTPGPAGPAGTGDVRARSLSYGELDLAARALACWLLDRRMAGQRVLILLDDAGLFAKALFGCLYAGAVPTPCPAPNGRRSADERVLSIVKDALVSVVLTDRESAPSVSRLLSAAGRTGLPCLALDDIELPPGEQWRRPDLDPDALAVLQYTSGSTRDPRGARLTHRNLLANQGELVELLGTGPHARVGGWLPLHHDMGLSGLLLHPLWLGTTGVIMPTADFARRPARWLHTISSYGVTVSGGPDIAYELCTRKTTDEQLAGLDLSGWQVAVNGSEPVRAETMAAFAERFGPVGFRPDAFVPAYGLAESTLLTAGRRARVRQAPQPHRVDAAALEHGEFAPEVPGRPVRTLVGCGAPVTPDNDMRIVDPDSGRVLPEDRVGEIWTRGASVADGYWKRPLESRSTFGQTTADGETGFLRTGDLGVLHRGELFVTGRLRDMVVVAGRNLHPQDIEHRIQQLSGLFGATAVFGAEPGRNRVVVVQEVRVGRRYDLDLAALAREIRACVARDFEVRATHVQLVRPGTIRRTSSGKIQRAAMRQLFLAGQLPALTTVSGTPVR
jgi:acyl-CoA synthetase (AMP-forming)/AMP-acid ligase II